MWVALPSFVGFVVGRLLETMRWQADVVWSDESLFWLREQPNHQNMRICSVTVDLSFSQLP